MERTSPSAGVLVFPTDADLLDRARAGDAGAFDELYRRHAQAAWRVAQAVTRNADDAADATSEAFTRVMSAVARGALASDTAFRPYLLAAARNASIDVLRRSGRLEATDDVERLDDRHHADTPSEQVVGAEDATLVARAFNGLPERWRSVLWLTEVEGVPARQAAVQLGLSPNGTAQLAVRARAGLRERYLQAHLRDVDSDTCRRAADHLGAYVAGGLPPRDIAKVDQHLAGCAECRKRLEELEDLGSSLRRVVLPMPAGLAAAAVAEWKSSLALPLASTPAAATGGVRRVLTSPGIEKALGSAAVGIFALGVLSATMYDHRGSPAQPFAQAEAFEEDGEVEFAPIDIDDTIAVASAPVVGPLEADGSSGTPGTRAGARDDEAARGIGGTSPITVIPPASPDDTSGPTGSPPPPDDDTTPPPPPPDDSTPPAPIPPPPSGGGSAVEIGVGGRTGDTGGSIDIGVGDDGPSVEVGDGPEEDGVSVETGGDLLPPITKHLP